MRRAILKALAKARDDRQATVREFFTELSDGGRMTIDAPALSFDKGVGGGGTGTAEMAIAPNFADAASPVPPEPQRMPLHVPTAGMGPMGNPPAVAAALPAPPTRAGGGGGGKGMIVALVGVGGLLLVAIAVVVVRSMKPKTEDQTLTNPFTSSSGVATIAPQVDTAALPTGSPIPSVSGSVAPADTGPAVKPTASPNPNTKPTSTAPDPNACDACIAAANAGNIQGAAAKYRQCNDPGKKSRCSAAVKGKAPEAAQNAAYNNQCGKAKAIGAAASAMGAGSGPLQAAVSKCK
jgi:hypothetical protein